MKINPEVMQQLKQLDITEKECNQVARCICRYSTPKTFSGTLSYVAYRVLNSIKAVFGCSDWQVAGKLLVKGLQMKTDHKIKIFTAMKESGIKNKGLTARINNKVIPLLNSILEFVPDMALELWVLKNEGKNEKAAEKIKQTFRTRINSVSGRLDKEIALIEYKYGLDLSFVK